MKNSETASSHWVIGLVLILCGTLIIISLVATYSKAQLSNTGNLPANVNITDDPPVISGALTWQQPFGGSVTDFDPTSPGVALTGIVNSLTKVLVNVNVSDANGYSGSTINLQMRLARSSLSSLAALPANFTSFNMNAFPQPITYLPERGPANCTDVATLSDTEHTWHCEADMLYYSDPTIYGPVDSTHDLTAASWKILLQATDDSNTTQDFHSLYFEWPQLIGIEFQGPGDSIKIGWADTSGTVVPDDAYSPVWAVAGNAGNAQIDHSITSDKLTDEAAWYCTGGGYPLVSDLHVIGHYGNTTNRLYDNMPAMTLSSPILFDQANYRRTISLGGNPGKNLGFRFATTEPIGVGLCTLSNLVITATYDPD